MTLKQQVNNLQVLTSGFVGGFNQPAIRSISSGKKKMDSVDMKVFASNRLPNMIPNRAATRTTAGNGGLWMSTGCQSSSANPPRIGVSTRNEFEELAAYFLLIFRLRLGVLYLPDAKPQAEEVGGS
jgi:hypothetical protein